MLTRLTHWRTLGATVAAVFVLLIVLLAWRVSRGEDPALAKSASPVARAPVPTVQADDVRPDDGFHDDHDGYGAPPPYGGVPDTAQAPDTGTVPQTRAS